MKIRTITTGVNLSFPIDRKEIKNAADFNLTAKGTFQRHGFDVQSTRISTQPWPHYLGESEDDGAIDAVKDLEAMCHELGVDFLSVGTTADPGHIALIGEMIKATNLISASVTIGDSRINYHAAEMAASVILKISKETDQGYGNFRFAAITNCPPDTPFFPAGYHEGDVCFSIGLECSDLVSQAFDGADDLVTAERRLKGILAKNFKGVEQTGCEIERDCEVKFKGIDLSPAPSLARDESLAFAFEKLGIERFGEPGTMAITGMVTCVLRSLEVRSCGYSGLMLPILEDFGLAKRWGEGILDIHKVLAYSAVCGTGLDCIPLPGDTPEKEIYGILLDMATMAVKLKKPLSARLLPVPGKKIGEKTDFRSPYLVDCKIIDPW